MEVISFRSQLIYPHVDRWVTTLLSWWSGQDERVVMKREQEEREKRPLTKAQTKRSEYLEFKEHVLDTNNVSVNGLQKLSTLAIEEKDVGTLIEIIDHLVCNRNVALSILLSIQHNPHFTYVTEHIILSRFFDFNMFMESIKTFSYTYQSIICQFYDLRRLSKVMHCPELMDYLSYY